MRSVSSKPLEIFSDGSAHDDADGENGVDAFFTGRRLDEIGSAHHANDGSPKSERAKSERKVNQWLSPKNVNRVTF